MPKYKVVDKTGVNNYEKSSAIRECNDGTIEYNGRRIEYSDYNILKFHHSLGYELVKENGEVLRNEICGFFDLEVYSDKDNKKLSKSFTLNISTAFGSVLAMHDLDIRILKKLSHFLNYAIGD